MSDDRDKPTFSERDRLLREKRLGDGPPRGHREQREQARASRQALLAADALFSEGPGGAEGVRLAKAIRDRHGTPELADACRAYRDAIGVPDDPGLLALFLDTGDRELLVPALERLLERKDAGSLEIPAGLRSTLRILAQHRDDTVAGISEDLLAD